jgi:hypothetical protein
MGYLPRVLFFNAFELGAVICKDAHVGAWRGVNSTNILDEGLRIREIGRRMNSKVKLVEIDMRRK